MSSPKRRIETDVSPDLGRYGLKYRVLLGDVVTDRLAFVSPNPSLVDSLAAPEARLTQLPNLGKSSTYDSRDRKRVPPFEGGLWKIHVELPDQYPYKSPSIGFVNRIYHPNIDELSGSVCLDVINQTWSPMYDMINIFEVFLPQLLRYPNPSDPLNGDAAAVLMRDPKKYEARVREYVAKYASKDAADEAGEDSESDDELSSVGSYMSGNEEPAGEMDDV
ncbi:hypothetical protein ACJ73_05791 [Blastomyces percursus]|uniref:Ubiquitin-conjugating enzyme E2 H n=1 Tax=Blastomyces percursus TaxID=1658174 RepID=A0A1J9Q2W4_9EURO|nr:hypothetical protein ACJ73_05791 [Blastomyces percursus]